MERAQKLIADARAGVRIEHAQLVAFVMSVPTVAAGLEALAGGPYALAKALELAVDVVIASPAERGSRGKAEG